MWNIHVYYIFVNAVHVFHLSQAQYHVIRKSGTKDYITLGSVFRTVTVNSVSECASLCASTSGCQSSMLMGQSCSLHTQPCTCPGERISNNLTSRYKIFHAGEVIINTAWEDARTQCQENGMHLVAIESDIEQRAIAKMLATKGRLDFNVVHIVITYVNM